VTALGVSGVSLVAPVLPELARHYGVPPGAMSLFQTAVMATGIVTAMLTARLGRRLGLAPVLTVLLLVYGTAGLSLVWVHSFPLAVGLRLLQGAGSGGLVTISFMALAALGPEHRLRATGHNAAVISAMMVILPVLGSGLGRIDAVAPFGFYGLAAVAAVALPRLVPARPPGAPTRTSGRRSPSGPVPALLAMNVLTNIVMFGWMLLLTPLLLDEAGVVLGLRGWALAAQSGLATLATVSTARLRDRQQFRGLLILGWATLAALLGTAAVAGPLPSAGLLVLSGVFYGVVNPVVVSVVAGRDGGRWLGWWQSSSRIGQVSGPLVAGGMYAVLPTPAVLLVGAGAAALTMALTWRRCSCGNLLVS